MMEHILPLIPFLTALVLIGLLAGFLAGLLGVGGGIVLVPAFFYVFSAMGYTGPELMQVCIATSLATIIVTSVRSLQSHHRKGAVLWWILRQWGPVISLGAVIGVVAASGLNSVTLQLVFGGLGICIGLYMILGLKDWTLGETLPQRPFRFVVGSLIGFVSVLLGIGGGSFGVPLMTLHRIPIHNAVATTAGFGLAISAPSAIAWLFVDVGNPDIPFTLGAVNIPAFLMIVPLTFAIAPLGAHVAHNTNAGRLKKFFGVFLILVAGNMVRTALF